MSIQDQYNAPTGNHRMTVNPQRRDGKFPVTYIFASGKRFNKLLSREKIESEIASEEYIVTLTGNTPYIFY